MSLSISAAAVNNRSSRLAGLLTNAVGFLDNHDLLDHGTSPA